MTRIKEDPFLKETGDPASMMRYRNHEEVLKLGRLAIAINPNSAHQTASAGEVEDPSIKELAEYIANDPSFNEMAEQLQKTLHEAATQDGMPNFDYPKYLSTMEQVMGNPNFRTMAERLCNALMQLEERMARIKEDPSCKHILDEIETGGPAAMMRCWNDEEVLKKLGLAMGIKPNSGEAVASSENSVPDETEYVGNEDESLVHQTASASYVEYWNSKNSLSPFIISQVQMDFSKKQTVECTMVGFKLKLNVVYLMSRYVARTQNLNVHRFYCCGVPMIKSPGNLCNQETKPVAGRESLFTILAKINKLELHVHRFVRELILVLYMSQYLWKMSRKRSIRRSLDIVGEDKVTMREACLAHRRETLAKIRTYKANYRAQKKAEIKEDTTMPCV